MRTALLTLAAVAAGQLVAADPPAKKAATLKPGDPAPPLKVTKWLAGPEVKGFEPGRVYVVEFWAVWCQPCLVMMSHLADIQEGLGPKGVTVVGLTAKDSWNTEPRVVACVEEWAGKLGYPLAYADDRATYDAYVTAAGLSGIPYSFVVGKDGRIAYIGHPQFLDVVLPKVLAGTWDAAKGTAEMAAADKLWDAAFAAIRKPDGNPAARLKAWEAFAAEWPGPANNPYMTRERVKLLIQTRRFAEARSLAEGMVAAAAKRNDLTTLGLVSDAVPDEVAAGHPDLAAVAVKEAEAWRAIKGEIPATLIALAKAYAAAGDAAKVREFGAKAVAAAEKRLAGDKDASGTLLVAAAYAASGDKTKAKALAEKALGMVDPKNPRQKEYVETQAKKYGAEAKGK